MPVVVERVERGVYACHLSGMYDGKDLIQTREIILEQVTVHQENAYTLIMEFAPNSRMIFNLKEMQKVEPRVGRAVETFFINPPTGTRLIHQTLISLFSSTGFQLSANRTIAIQQARQIIAYYDSTSPS